MVRPALQVLRGLPALLETSDLLAPLDLLGRVVRLAEQEIQDRLGPLVRLVPQGPQELRELREKLAERDLAVRLDLLGLLAREDPPDLQGLRALALLVQRDLLELDPPGLPDLPETKAPPVKPATPAL